jgi:hypothetical protein
MVQATESSVLPSRIPALPELDVEVKQSADFEAMLKTWHRMLGTFSSVPFP